MSTNYIIIKQNFFGKEILRYPGILLNRTSTAITIEAYFQREKILIHNVYINPGDRFVEKILDEDEYNELELPINFQRNTNFAKDFLQIKFQFLYKNKIHKGNILNKFT